MWQSILGLFIFPLLALPLSENWRLIPYKKLAIGIILQIILGLLILKAPFIQSAFLFLNKAVLMIESATNSGATFMFGYLAGGPLPFNETTPGASFIVAFRVLPIVLVMSALSAVLFHWGILQWLVKNISKALEKTMGISGVQGLGVGANIFLGIVEAPLFIKPYLAKMSRSSLFTVMTAGMATVAGTVMVLYASILNDVIPNALGHILTASLISAPAAVIFAQIIVPETQNIHDEVEVDIPKDTHNAFDALVKGTMEGITLLLSIVAMIIVLFALVNLTNQILGFFPEVGGAPITLELLFSFLMRPLVWLMGIPWEEASAAANLMSTKVVLNEFVSYQQLAGLSKDALSERSRMILTYAMCGFANFASLGLIVGSIGTLVPERRPEVVELGAKSLISGLFATCMTGAIVGIIS